MKIKNIHLDGYGIYHNQALQNLSKGLNIFTGKNESGKSTLMQFIRMMFFGNKRGQRNTYPPLRGGNYGGSMDIALEDGKQYVLKRTVRNLTVMDEMGAPLGISPQLAWLGGLERETYESIFSIGLADLQGLKLLDSEDVKGRFFTAGVGINASALNETLAALDAKMTALLKKKGDGVINRLLAEKSDTDDQIAALENEDKEYARAQAEGQRLLHLIEEASGELAATDARLLRLNELTKAREPWAQLQIVEEKVSILAYAKDFPADGAARYAGLLNSAADLNADIAVKKQLLDDMVEKHQHIILDEGILEEADQIEHLYKDRGKFAAALEGLSQDKAECDRAWQGFLKSLQEIGAGWDESKLEAVDTSVSIRQQVREYAEAFAYSRTEQCQMIERERGEAERVNALRAKLAQFELKLSELDESPVRTEEELVAQEAATKTVQTKLMQLDGWNARLDLKRQEAERLTGELINIRQKAAVKSSLMPVFIPVLIGLVTAGCAGYFGMAGSAGAVAGTLVVGLPLVWYSHVLRNNMKQMISSREQERAAEEIRLDQYITKTEFDINELQARMAQVRQQIDELGTTYGWGELNNLDDLNDIVQKVAYVRQTYQKWDGITGKIDEAEQELRDSVKAIADGNAHKEQAAQQLRQLERNWQAWLNEKGFPFNAKPEGFDTVLTAIEAARVAHSYWQSLQGRVDNTKNYLAVKRTEISGIITRIGGMAAANGDLEDLDQLYAALVMSKANQGKANNLLQTIGVTEQELAVLNNRMKAVRKQYAELLSEVDLTCGETVKEVPQFRKMAQDYQEWKNYQNHIENNKAFLRAVAGSEEKERSLFVDLAAMTAAEIETKFERLKLARERLQNSINVSRDARGRLNEKLEQMRQSLSLEQARVKQEQYHGQLKHSVREWLSGALCRSLLEETRAVYERERQPGVIKEANALLKLMTGSRYRLITPGGLVQLEDRVHKVKGEQAWSCGLADQVYLAIRLSLAKEFNKAAEPLPVILDDVLVKFDCERQKGIIKGLLQAAAAQQIFLFTCQDQFMHIMKEVVSSSDFSEIPYQVYTLTDGIIQEAIV